MVAHSQRVQLITTYQHSGIVNGQQVVYDVCLWALSTSSRINHYFISVMQRRGRIEEIETSPVIGNSRDEALKIFQLLTKAEGGVAPCHLSDVIRDTKIQLDSTNNAATAKWLVAEASTAPQKGTYKAIR